MEMVGIFFGYCGYQASIRGNALKGHQIGPNIIDFLDGTKITFEHPPLYLRGLMWGERVMDYYGTMSFHDEANDIHVTITFNPDQRYFLTSFFLKKCNNN